MKSIARWLGYGFLAAVAAAIAAFPATDAESFSKVDPLAKAIADARRRFSLQSELLRREHSLELVRELKAVPPRSGGGLYDVVRSTDVPASADTIIRNAADAMFRGVARPDSAVRVIIRLVMDTGSMLAGAPVQRTTSQTSTDTFFPSDSSDRICAVVVRIQERALYSRRMSLGADACYWYKAYGMPGPGMRAIIGALQGGILGDHGRRNLYYRGDSTFFSSLARYDVRIMQCMASVMEACEHLATGRTSVDQDSYTALSTRGWVGYGRNYGSYLDVLPALLLTEFERDVGGARFRQVWTSDAPFAVAFAQVKGVPLGEWVHDLITTRTRRSSPLPGTRGSLVLLVTIPAFLALGMWGLPRRSAVA